MGEVKDASGLRNPYPAIEPYAKEMLSVGDGNEIYVEQCGNPEGKPVVFVHGGPGGGCTPEHRRMFDPDAYRIVLFDQRGCGRSTPHVADGADLETNTTWHLVDDMEAVRTHLGIESWQVFGGSWGTTLALAYAQAHPERVTELVLRGIFLCRPLEIDWFYRGGAAHIFPDEWAGYMAVLGEEAEGDHLRTFAAPGFDHVARYHELLGSPDPETALRAAHAWTTWEKNTSSLVPEKGPADDAGVPETEAGADGSEDDRFALAFARIENHYFFHDAFLGDRPLLDGMDALRDIPGVIVHGRYDVVCPVTNAFELAERWPGAELHISPEAGHAMAEPVTTHHLIEATDAFRPQRRPSGED
ncbi:prolyl aminopeptidase [Dietzia sp.]|uniref:prolyl aminopeptidase n=1 Tax=Dietzia sp. TaxID=1871616 RepID=UPI002FDB95E4